MRLLWLVMFIGRLDEALDDLSDGDDDLGVRLDDALEALQESAREIDLDDQLSFASSPEAVVEDAIQPVEVGVAAIDAGGDLQPVSECAHEEVVGHDSDWADVFASILAEVFASEAALDSYWDS